ncbi:DsbA family oxidoreductase [Rubrivivax gelatinosus]|uniref:Disulfide bond formation protein DsbA n=1 Tax=Rubrivivax gelatinosus TaxID=28068 RepID=A0ABS1DX20_RUBGE|nr:DsbA family oxidoreductase [Rubrivivax gelatinosus]MBK1714609.1 disulfide bond formation protein DsbA [Rubrivivax gelatinosus]
MKQLRIDFVSDVVCPWCAVGLAALESALERLAGEVQAEIHVRPFELNPDMAAEGEAIDEHLQRKYGGAPEQFAAVRRTLAERGAAVGFSFGERTRIWNTFDAHRLLHGASLQGRGLELKRALLAAYHGEGRNPGDHAELVRIATSVGLDAAWAAALLASDEHAEAVRTEEQRWLALGIHSVPAVVVNERHLISGGQPPEVFEQALREIAAEG